jgi:hypothetical protein
MTSPFFFLRFSSSRVGVGAWTWPGMGNSVSPGRFRWSGKKANRPNAEEQHFLSCAATVGPTAARRMPFRGGNES